MSLRIYIKETPKFSSNKRHEQSLPLSPEFNSMNAPKFSRPAKKPPAFAIQPKESPPTLREHKDDILSQSLREHNLSTNTQGFSNPLAFNSFEDKSKLITETEEEEKFRRIKPELQEGVDKLLVKLRNIDHLSDRQLKEFSKESQKVIKVLMDELERQSVFEEQKQRENALLRSFNVKLNSGFKSLYGKNRIETLGIDDSRENSAYHHGQEDLEKLLEENFGILNTLKKLSNANSELVEEVALLREMANTSEKALQQERETFKKLKSRVEDLLVTNDELNNKLLSTEEETKRLSEAKAQVERLLFEATGKNHGIDELKRSLVVAEFQSPHHNMISKRVYNENQHSASPYLGGSSTGWTNLRIDSPLALHNEKIRDDLESKKNADLKNDNSRLMKIIENNQQTIKNLRESFTDLEKRNSMRFEEMRSYYEAKLKALSNKEGYRNDIRY